MRGVRKCVVLLLHGLGTLLRDAWPDLLGVAPGWDVHGFKVSLAPPPWAATYLSLTKSTYELFHAMTCA
jgi:hypothetical protein